MEENITLDEDNIEIVDKFAYLDDVLSTEGGVQEAVHSRIRSGWIKFKEVSSVLGNKCMLLKIRRLYSKALLPTRENTGF